MNDPAAELRAAAQRLRTLAEAATPGPWTANCEFLTVDTPDGRALINVLLSDTDTREAAPQAETDAAYVAAMHPGVALALAALLDSYAGALLEEADAGTNVEVVYREELALARLVLEAT